MEFEILNKGKGRVVSKVTRQDALSDDCQAAIDQIMHSGALQLKRHVREAREKALRNLMIEYSDVEPALIRKLFNETAEATLTDYDDSFGHQWMDILRGVKE